MATLREQIVAEIMKLVRPEPVPREKPTIAELEKILNEDAGPVNINPDGSVSTMPPPATVGDVADAVMRVIEAHKSSPPIFECPACGKDIADQDTPHAPGCERP